MRKFNTPKSHVTEDTHANLFSSANMRNSATWLSTTPTSLRRLYDKQVLLTLCAVRVVIGVFIQTHYVADEYYQSQEIAHSIVFGVGYQYVTTPSGSAHLSYFRAQILQDVGMVACLQDSIFCASVHPCRWIFPRTNHRTRNHYIVGMYGIDRFPSLSPCRALTTQC